MVKKIFKRLCLVNLILFTTQAIAVTPARIYNSDEIEQADTDALIAETAVFKSIGMGIALSISQCEGQSDCIPAVDHAELERLLKALDNRIEYLTGLVNSEEVAEEDLNTIITAYVDQRENYLRYLDQLSEIVPETEEDLEDTFAQEIGNTGEGSTELGNVIKEEFSIFEDVDEELEDEGEFEEDFNPENL